MKIWTSFDGQEEGSWKNVWVKVEAQLVGGWRPLALPSMVSQLMPPSWTHVFYPLPSRTIFSQSNNISIIHPVTQRFALHWTGLQSDSSLTQLMYVVVKQCQTLCKPTFGTSLKKKKGRKKELWENGWEQVEGKELMRSKTKKLSRWETCPQPFM